MMFHCRERELSELNGRYKKGKFECVIIYGRRRVGKTALINEFCKDKPTVFFSALDANPQENLESLSRAIYEKDYPDATSTPVFPDFTAALSQITRMAERDRLVFVIDEYPYLAKSSKSISSRLQHFIDHSWANSNLFLILCGSSMSFMENQVLGYESPLYGRRTAQMKIQALTYKEITAFNPTLTNEQQALIYGITGGIPHYINKLDVNDSIDTALKENFFNTSAYLYEEPGNLLKQELREPALYNSIITAIATGSSRLNEISSKVGAETGACVKYLKVLLDLGIVKRETPITEKPGRKSIYAISDNFFRFWYRFVPQNMSAISANRTERIYDSAIRQYLSDYMGLVFEQMCRDYLLRYAENLPIEPSDVGQWWGTDAKEKKEVQIDIVGTPIQGNEYIIGSCKYRNRKTDIDEYELLKHYAKVFGRGDKYHYCFFSKSGYTERMRSIAENNGLALISLDDLYK